LRFILEYGMMRLRLRRVWHWVVMWSRGCLTNDGEECDEYGCELHEPWEGRKTNSQVESGEPVNVKPFKP
jgi:hypothetical protein